MKYILALDQGTTSSRAILFDREGQIRGIAQQEFEQYFPQSGWVEHDPMDIWHSQLAVAQKVLRDHAVTAADIAAIGITNQRETTVVWDRKTGQAVYNAIVWQDHRAADRCALLEQQGKAELIQQKTGLMVAAYFSATKLQWILDEVPHARERAQRGELAFGTVDSWLIWHLTQGQQHVTDVSNAARTMLFNIHDMDWDEDLLNWLRIPRAILPELRPSSAVVGQCSAEFFGSPLPIAGIAGDQQAATFGQACLQTGMAKNTYGTGCFMLMNMGAKPRPSHHRLLTTVGWQLKQKTSYCFEGSIFMGGAVVQWLRDGLKLIPKSEDVEALAASVPDAGGAWLVPAFSGLGAPYWDGFARGTLVGMSRGTTDAHIAHAALEAIALQSMDVLEAMQQDADAPVTELRVDGGACKNNLLMQMQANALGVPVVRPKVIETTALGAAYLAGLAVGFWQDLDEIQAQWQVDRRFEPQLSLAHRQEKRHQWTRAVERSRNWLEA